MRSSCASSRGNFWKPSASVEFPTQNDDVLLDGTAVLEGIPLCHRYSERVQRLKHRLPRSGRVPMVRNTEGIDANSLAGSRLSFFGSALLRSPVRPSGERNGGAAEDSSFGLHIRIEEELQREGVLGAAVPDVGGRFYHKQSDQPPHCWAAPAPGGRDRRYIGKAHIATGKEKTGYTTFRERERQITRQQPGQGHVGFQRCQEEDTQTGRPEPLSCFKTA